MSVTVVTSGGGVSISSRPSDVARAGVYTLVLPEICMGILILIGSWVSWTWWFGIGVIVIGVIGYQHLSNYNSMHTPTCVFGPTSAMSLLFFGHMLMGIGTVIGIAITAYYINFYANPPVVWSVWGAGVTSGYYTVRLWFAVFELIVLLIYGVICLVYLMRMNNLFKLFKEEVAGGSGLGAGLAINAGPVGGPVYQQQQAYQPQPAYAQAQPVYGQPAQGYTYSPPKTAAQQPQGYAQPGHALL